MYSTIMAKIIKNISKTSVKIVKQIKKRINKKRTATLPWLKSKNYELNFNDLPADIIITIFSYISLQELFNNIKLVCKLWYTLANSAGLWKIIKAGPEVPTELLLNWLDNAPKLKILQINNRIDAGEILKKIQKCNRYIQELKINYCWGCGSRINLPSSHLCNVILRCPYLNSISLTGSRFISCKFFRLLATRDLILKNRKRNVDHQRRSKKIHYYGSALRKQLQVFLQSRLDYNRNKLALFTVNRNNASKTQTFRQEITLKNEEDIQKVLDALSYQ